MTSADILLCILVDLERTQRVNEELKLEEFKKPKSEQNEYFLGMCQGRIYHCDDLIRFIKNNVEVKK